MQCSISDWGCVYHACMSDECQLLEVMENGEGFGPGNCEEEADNKTEK